MQSNQEVNKILVYLHGSDSPLAQVSRIKEGMSKIGFYSYKNIYYSIELVTSPEVADLIYLNNPPYDWIFALKDSGKLKNQSQIICNFLDLPLHLLNTPSFNPYEHAENLARADAITTISEFVRGQIANFYDLPSYLVYNPPKDVSPDMRLFWQKAYPEFKVACVGRLNDPNKRIGDLGIPALIYAGFNENQVAMIGPENPGWGTYMGLVSDAQLNAIYNSVDYVMFPSDLEGWGMPVQECMICGAIPILTSSLTTRNDLHIPESWITYPSAKALAYRIMQLESSKEYKESAQELAMNIGQTLLQKNNKKKVAENILNVYFRTKGAKNV